MVTSPHGDSESLLENKWGNIICAFDRSTERHPDGRLFLCRLQEAAVAWVSIPPPTSMPQLRVAGRSSVSRGMDCLFSVLSSVLHCFAPIKRMWDVIWGQLWLKGKTKSFHWVCRFADRHIFLPHGLGWILYQLKSMFCFP